jgi:hypothetical protein
MTTSAPDTKLSAVRKHMESGSWQQAIRLAAKFPRLDSHRNAILDAHEAYNNPRFMVQLGKDLEQLKAAGMAALIDRFGC